MSDAFNTALPDGRWSPANENRPLTHPEDRMDSQLNYLIARQRQAELVSRAEQARLAIDARAAVSAPSRGWNLGRLVATRRLRPAGLVAAAQPAGPPQECVRCDA
jgi:hypothetical protein